MNRFIAKIFVIFLAIGLWEIGLFEPLTSDLGGQVSIAEASHRGSGGGRFCRRFPTLCESLCRRNPRFCQPPTVSELPIQYMVLTGALLISLCGGIAFYIRKRKMKSFPEA
jgi:hypothetical protein